MYNRYESDKAKAWSQLDDPCSAWLIWAITPLLAFFGKKKKGEGREIEALFQPENVTVESKSLVSEQHAQKRRPKWLTMAYWIIDFHVQDSESHVSMIWNLCHALESNAPIAFFPLFYPRKMKFACTIKFFPPRELRKWTRNPLWAKFPACSILSGRSPCKILFPHDWTYAKLQQRLL